MLLSVRQLGRRVLATEIRSLNTSAVARAAAKEKWDLYAGVLVERLPVVSKLLNPMEQQFQEYLYRVEFEKSLKSDTELRHERELHQAELVKKGKMEVELEDGGSKQTVQDLRDAYVDELKKFELAPRATADDKAQNTKSTDRCLDDSLYLLVEHKLGQSVHQLLPQGVRLDGETMRQAAERVLREKCGDQIAVQFYGNAPCGFYKYKYPSGMRDQGSVGAKVFFFRAALKGGNVSQEAASKYEWLTKVALNEKLKNPTYSESVNKFLL